MALRLWRRVRRAAASSTRHPNPSARDKVVGIYELLEHILSFLDARTLRRAQLVDRRWRNIILETSLLAARVQRSRRHVIRPILVGSESSGIDLLVYWLVREPGRNLPFKLHSKLGPSFRRPVLVDNEDWDIDGVSAGVLGTTSSIFLGASLAHSDTFVLIYSASCRQSFDQIKAWLAQMRGETEPLSLLVETQAGKRRNSKTGLKCLPGGVVSVTTEASTAQPVVKPSEGAALARELDCPLFEMSAENGDVVDELFAQMCRAYKKMMKETRLDANIPSSTPRKHRHVQKKAAKGPSKKRTVKHATAKASQPPAMQPTPHPATFLLRQPRSASAIREHIRVECCSSFIPEAGVYNYMHKLFDLAPPRQDGYESASTVASDAFCILELGTRSGNRQLILGYYDLYGKAVQRLRTEIARQGNGCAEDTRAIVAAVSFLGLCESYVTCKYDSRGFIEHMKGLISLLSNGDGDWRSRQCGTIGKFFDQAVFQHWFYVQSLGYGLVARKAVVAQPPPVWDFHALLPRQDAPLQRARPALTDLALLTPAILEELESVSRKVERCPDDPSAAEDTNCVVSKAMQLRGDLNVTMVARTTEAKVPPYVRCDIHDYPSLVASLGNLASTFPIVFRFSDLPTGKVYRTYWICLLALDQAILDFSKTLLHLPGDADILDTLSDRDLVDLRLEADSTAYALAQSVPYLSSSSFKSFGPYGVLLPLHFLENYYAWVGRGVEEQVAWCQRVKEAVGLGYRIKKILAASN